LPRVSLRSTRATSTRATNRARRPGARDDRAPLRHRIDLGTTNCTLAWVDLADGTASVRVLEIPQLDTPCTIHASTLLPSFFCYATPGEIAGGQLDPITAMPLAEASGYFIGALARERMGGQPGRVIHSAKSWLTHAGIDREARLLPFGSDEIAPSSSSRRWRRARPTSATCGRRGTTSSRTTTRGSRSKRNGSSSPSPPRSTKRRRR